MCAALHSSVWLTLSLVNNVYSMTGLDMCKVHHDRGLISRGIVLRKLCDVTQIGNSQQQAGCKLKPVCKDVKRQEGTSATRSS